jgi:AcrR family transcriptional regulator
MTATPRAVDRPRPRRADARRNRARLVEAARTAFAEAGADVPLEEVARRAGVGIGTLYRHFPCRDDLIEAVVGDRVDELVAEAEELLGADDPVGALRRWLRAAVDLAVGYRGLAASLVAAAQGEGRLSEAFRRQEAAADALVARAREVGGLRADVTTAEVLGLASAVAWLVEQGRATDPDRLLDLVVDGLRRPAGG